MKLFARAGKIAFTPLHSFIENAAKNNACEHTNYTILLRVFHVPKPSKKGRVGGKDTHGFPRCQIQVQVLLRSVYRCDNKILNYNIRTLTTELFLYRIKVLILFGRHPGKQLTHPTAWVQRPQ